MTRIRNCIFLAAFLFSGLDSTCQSSILKDFSAYQADDDLVLTWTISRGAGCNDLTISYSQDSINFIHLYTYPGICGSAETDKTYNWTWTNPPVNLKSWYRIEIPLEEITKIISFLFIDYSNSGYLLFPNPVTEESLLYFKDSNPSEFILEIFNSEGKQVAEKEVTVNPVSLAGLFPSNGLFFFRLKSSEKIIIGRLFVY